MHRNLDRRVEALVKIAQPDHIRELTQLLDLGMGKSVSVWKLDQAGNWNRSVKSQSGEQLLDMQDELMARTLEKKKVR
jgi:polyphosphate kinase